VQLYVLVGVVLTSASVKGTSNSYYYHYDENYTFNYLGTQHGIGLEFRLSKNIALNADVRLVVGGCIGGDCDGMFGSLSARGGATFYW